jgi:hypothetical protein
VRIVVTILLALALSTVAGAALGVGAADWVRGDESYIVVFAIVPVMALVALAFFLIASTRRETARALWAAAKILVALLLLALFGLSAVEFGANGTWPSAWRGIQLLLTIAGCCLLTVLVQWAVFRWRVQPAAPEQPKFGRGGSVPG